MITKEKTSIYNKYQGNIDARARSGRRNEQVIMNDEDWLLIDELIQGLESIQKGYVSDHYKSQIIKKLNANCDSQETIKELSFLIGKY